MKNINKILAQEKKNFLATLEKTKNILLGGHGLEMRKEHPEMFLPTYPNNSYADFIAVNLQSNFIEVQGRLNQIGINIPNDFSNIVIPLNDGRCEFPPTSIEGIITFVKREYPGSVYEPDKHYSKSGGGKPKNTDNYNPYENIPQAHKECLQIAKDNYTEALNTVTLLTEKLNEDLTGRTNKYTLDIYTPEGINKAKNEIAKHLYGAKQRVELFKTQLQGANEQYAAAQNNYACQEIQKLIDEEFGEDNIKEGARLEKMWADEIKKIAHIPKIKKLQNKQDKINLEFHYSIRADITAAQNALYRIKELIEQKYETPQNRNKFMQEFLEELY